MNRYFLCVFSGFLTLVWLPANALADDGGASTGGGNGIVNRILLARPIARDVVGRASAALLPPDRRTAMEEILDRPPLFTEPGEQIVLMNSKRRPEPVSAEYQPKTGRIKFSVDRISQEQLSLFEVVALYLHEAGHPAGLSVSMVLHDSDPTRDIGYRLAKEESDKPDSLFRNEAYLSEKMLALGVERTDLREEESLARPVAPPSKPVRFANYLSTYATARVPREIWGLPQAPGQPRDHWIPHFIQSYVTWEGAVGSTYGNAQRNVILRTLHECGQIPQGSQVEVKPDTGWLAWTLGTSWASVVLNGERFNVHSTFRQEKVSLTWKHVPTGQFTSPVGYFHIILTGPLVVERREGSESLDPLACAKARRDARDSRLNICRIENPSTNRWEIKMGSSVKDTVYDYWTSSRGYRKAFDKCKALEHRGVCTCVAPPP